MFWWKLDNMKFLCSIFVTECWNEINLLILDITDTQLPPPTDNCFTSIK